MKLNIILLTCVLSFSAYASKTFLGSGTLRANESSTAFSMGPFQNITVVIPAGVINCLHYTVKPPSHNAYVAINYNVGSGWYQQRNCGAGNANYCALSAQQGSSLQFTPMGAMLQLKALPQPIDSGYVECQNSIRFEVWGE